MDRRGDDEDGRFEFDLGLVQNAGTPDRLGTDEEGSGSLWQIDQEVRDSIHTLARVQFHCLDGCLDRITNHR